MRLPSRRGWAYAVALVVLLAGAVASLLNVAPVYVTRDFNAKSATHWGGNAYALQISQHLPHPRIATLLELSPDSNEAPTASSLRVLEQGKNIGQPHALHADIGAKGLGRFSHWESNLVFSSSDNSSPLSNGRTYAVTYPIAPSGWIGISLLVLGTAALGFLLIRSTGDPPLVCALALLAVGISACVIYCFPIHATRELEPDAIVLHDGKRYAASVAARLPRGMAAWFIGLEPDSPGAQTASTLRLLEQGRRIGLPHTSHEEIARVGQGRFSHWGDYLLLSTSDNSSPSTNGRAYAVSYPLAPARWICVTLLLAGAAALALALRPARARPASDASARLQALSRRMVANRHRLFWVGAGALWLYMNVVFQSLVTAPIASPDSHGYLYWSLFRTPGYPLLLSSYHWVAGTWTHLGLYQLNLIIAGLMVLAYGLARVTRSYAFAWILLALVFGFGTMLVSGADMLTEPAFTAFAMAHVGLVLLFIESGRGWHALLAGVALAMTILVKSVAVVFLGPLILLIAFLRGRRKSLALLVLVPAAAAWIAPSAYNLVRNGFFESSIAGGYALVGHVAWAIQPKPGSPYEQEATLIERRLRPVLAKRPTSFPTLGDYVNYTSNEYNTLLWQNIVPEVSEFYAKRYPAEAYGGSCTWKECRSPLTLRLTRAFVGISKETIQSDPWAFAYHVMAHDYGLWRDSLSHGMDYLAATNARAEQLHAAYDPALTSYRKILGEPKLKDSAERMDIVARTEDSWAKRALDLVTFPELAEWVGAKAPRYPVVLVAIGLAASMLIFWVSRLSTAAIAFCYCGLCLNAYFLGTALAQPSLLRYAWTVQGIVCALLLLAIWLAGTLVLGAIRRRGWIRPRSQPA